MNITQLLIKMADKIAVSNLAALLYVSFVVSSTILVGILPVYVNPPICEELANNTQQAIVAKIDETNNLNINKNHFEFKHKALTPRQQNIRNKLESELDKRSDLKTNTTQIPLCKELINPGSLYYPWYDTRLPTNYRPLHYNLYFYFPLWGIRSIYSGDVQIKVEILNPTNLIMLHISFGELPIFRSLTDKDGNKVEIECNGEFLEYEYYIIKTNGNLIAENGPYNLDILFLASLEQFESGIFEFNFAVDDDPASANS